MKIQLKPTEHAQSLVEFSFGAVILIILLAGVVDLGRAFFTYIALRDAAQEGAIYGSMCPKDSTAIIQRARSSSNSPIDLLNDPKVAVTCTYVETGAACGVGALTPGTGIQVTVTYNHFDITMPFLGTLIGTQQITIRARVQDTILRNVTCP